MAIDTETTPIRLREVPYWKGWPILYEDDGEGELGESNPHVQTDQIINILLRVHFEQRREIQVFSNMNLYYLDAQGRTRLAPYVSPDDMIVQAYERLPEETVSYRIGTDGPAPLATIEILSQRSAQQRDLEDKVEIYAGLSVAEYILVDPFGKFLPRKLLLKRLQPDGTWKDECDADGGITSELGFRFLYDANGNLTVINASTGEAYPHPIDAVLQSREMANRIRDAEEQSRALAEEVARLQELLKKQNPSTN